MTSRSALHMSVGKVGALLCSSLQQPSVLPHHRSLTLAVATVQLKGELKDLYKQYQIIRQVLEQGAQ